MIQGFMVVSVIATCSYTYLFASYILVAAAAAIYLEY